MLEKNGWFFKRSGGNHDIYTNGKEQETIPRHNDIDEDLAKTIIKRRNLK
ncbi:MAG: type II toxin-antitoxin system HicA family toxin [Flexilinea sp.]